MPKPGSIVEYYYEIFGIGEMGIVISTQPPKAFLSDPIVRIFGFSSLKIEDIPYKQVYGRIFDANKKEI